VSEVIGKPNKNILLMAAGYVLAPWQESHDLDFVDFLAREKDVASLMALSDYYSTPEQVAKTCSRWRQTWEEKDYGPYAVLSEEAGILKFAGFVGPHHIPGFEAPIWSGALASAHRSQGIGTAIEERIGGHLKLKGSQTFVKAKNTPLQKALENANWRRLYERDYNGHPVVWFQRDDWS
jgi:RimJ/RimL family protein N-acetyltransferase